LKQIFNTVYAVQAHPSGNCAIASSNNHKLRKGTKVMV